MTIKTTSQPAGNDANITQVADIEAPLSTTAGNNATLSELIQLAFQHHNFLQALHSMGVTLKKPSSESFRRYKDLWLPLVAKSYESERVVRNQLAPPPDIAWLWHCHRLAPAKYEEYIRQQFGFTKNTKAESILDLCDPQAPFVMTSPGASDLYARDVWKESYPSEPFFLPEDQAAVEMAPPYQLLCGFDLIGSTTRQATFLWQISGPDFFYTGTDTLKYMFLQQGVQNYESFLKLKRQPGAKKQMLVPTYQIDLIWHTHILSSIKKYNEDCILILGSKFDHDDSFTDRTHGGKLDVAYKATSKLWKKAYGTEYGESGALYRGEPPARYFQSAWTSADIAHQTVSAQSTTAQEEVVPPQAVVTEEATNAGDGHPWTSKQIVLVFFIALCVIALLMFGFGIFDNDGYRQVVISVLIIVSLMTCHSGRGRGHSGGGGGGGGCGGGGCGGGGCGGGG
jgi:hypothetical protein